MKRLSFTKRNRSGNLLHIETDHAIVNVHVDLADVFGNEIESIEIRPDPGCVIIDGTEELDYLRVRVRNSVREQEKRDA